MIAYYFDLGVFKHPFFNPSDFNLSNRVCVIVNNLLVELLDLTVNKHISMPITLVIYNFGCMHLTVAIEVEPIVAINQNKLCLFTDKKADNIYQ